MLQQKNSYQTFEANGRTVTVDDFIYRRLFRDPDVLPKRKYTFIRCFAVFSNCVFLVLKINANKRVILSRYIMQAGKGELVDHRNRNPLDNRRSNLRIATARENMLNRKLKNNTGFIGVCAYRGKYNSYVKSSFKTKGGKRLIFSCQDTPFNRILAALARDKFILQESDEEFAPLNFGCWQYEPLRSILMAEDLKKYKEKSPAISSFGKAIPMRRDLRCGSDNEKIKSKNFVGRGA